MLQIKFTLNGKNTTADIDEGTRVIDMLRNSFNLTGTKESCGQGECGSCTILLNNEAVHSCLLLAAQINDCSIVTIEGLEKDGQLDAMQQAFLDTGAIQCGYCTPGMIMAARGLLLKNPDPSEQEIREAMAGNLCRCTGYKKIGEAVALAAERQKV